MQEGDIGREAEAAEASSALVEIVTEKHLPACQHLERWKYTAIGIQKSLNSER